MKHFAQKIIAAFCFLATPCLAGGIWSGGGGIMIRDSMNPWFIQNTTDVSYCIIIDLDNFHTSNQAHQDAEDAIQKAIGYWKKEFPNAFVVGNVVTIAAQNFHSRKIVSIKNGKADGECAGNTDIVFQFGFLDRVQKKYFKDNGVDIHETIAHTIRTDYDKVHLRGKGFVYVAADSGPLKLQGEGLVEMPWQKEKGLLLVEALKHELGHIFGIPHMGLGTLMAADYLDLLLSQSADNSLTEWNKDSPFFHIRGNMVLRDYCQIHALNGGWHRFLNAPTDDNCIRVELLGDQIKFKTGKKNNLQERGILNLQPQKYETFTWQDAGRLYMTPQQSIIHKIPEGAGTMSWLCGPFVKISERTGTFTSTDNSRAFKATVTLNPLGLGYALAKFSAEMDGFWHTNIDHY